MTARRDADEILRLAQAFDEAELNADAERLDRLLADDFVSIGERGFVLTKDQWTDRHGDFRLIGCRTTDAHVRHYDRTANLHGAQHVEATWLGEPMSLSVQFSQVWIRRDEDWLLASIQYSTLATD